MPQQAPSFTGSKESIPQLAPKFTDYLYIVRAWAQSYPSVTGPELAIAAGVNIRGIDGNVATRIQLKVARGEHRFSVMNARAGMFMINLKTTISRIEILLVENTEASVTYAAPKTRQANAMTKFSKF
ncbi:MAG: hypothetical protein K5863_08670 [Nitratireductor sp.]|uniref:hypothetical protein n=1 Tax=Nitratireductor sp. TaxID=1872084 RepID=UPI0026126984|nr:hypothetical protein [Nitratireductor sp.]MCV0350138.1 hypothetical protein [Nitratireductor sp.]